jgi:LuxR family maltose regulon positive regulatory protein
MWAILGRMMISLPDSDASLAPETPYLTASRRIPQGRSGQRSGRILWEKLRRPAAIDRYVERPRLTELLLRSSGTFSATMITGRAGSGKSVVAAAFAERSKSFCWYSLSSVDVDWSIFAPHFAISLLGEKAASDDSIVSIPIDSDPLAIENFISATIEKSSRPMVIVIDDIHHVFDAPWFVNFFSLLISLLPPTSHLIITSRSRPPAPLWRMRSKQVLNVIDERQLAFDLVETETLFAMVSLPLSIARSAHKTCFGRASKLAEQVEYSLAL